MSSLYVPTRRLLYTFFGKVNEVLRIRNQNVFILCYHSIDDCNWDFSISVSEFKKQITYLESRYSFISMSELHDFIEGKHKLTKPSVVLTFDDGYKDILQVKEFLKAKGIRPTVFIISNPKSVRRDELGTDKEFLSLKDIHSLAAAGWEIGSHTATHPNMHTLSAAQVDLEVIDSKSALEKSLGLPIQDIAFPKGRYSNQILKASKKAGYRLALTMNDGEILPGTNKHQIPRIGVDGTHSLGEFQALPTKLVVSIRTLIKSFGYGK